MRCSWIVVFFILVGQNNALYSDEDNALLPRLFHLDDHDHCLLQPGSLYCLGEFDLAPVGTSRIYENIQKYASNNPHAFNRSRLHRGYCVSERCPTTSESNASLRFEQCVAARARRHGLTARLRTLHYCSTQHQHAARAQRPPDAAQQLFTRVVYALLALNIVGTVYDVVGKSKKKNRLITAWSVRASWQRLTATYDDGDSRLTQFEVFQGMRVMTLLISIYAHICSQHYQFYVINPQFLETLANRVDGVILSNGTSLIQFFVMLSSFLMAYNLLLYSEKHPLSLIKMLPVLVIKRIIRIAPVHLLVVGFVATYLPAINFAAVCAVVEEYSASCRRKFWTHAFFLNNIVEKRDNNCLMPSWFLPVDVHLFILSSVLTIIMYRRRHLALHLYAALCIISALAAGLVAYVMGYRSVMYDSVPEKIRGLHSTGVSFGMYYTSTWGALPACFLGLFLAHLHYELQQAKYDWNKNQWFKRMYPWTLPIGALVTLMMGMTFRQYRQPWVTALHLTLDRPVMMSFVSILVIGCINVDGGVRRFFSWRGWRVPARLSLPMMLCHWVVSVVITARPVAYRTSVFDVSLDYLATVFYGYVISVPVALLVEIPVQRFFAQLF